MLRRRSFIFRVLSLLIVAIAGVFALSLSSGARADDKKDPGWMCFVNTTGHHEVKIVITDEDDHTVSVTVDAGEGAVLKLRPGSYTWKGTDHDGKATKRKSETLTSGDVRVVKIIHDHW